jgi:hypothetical protein
LSTAQVANAEPAPPDVPPAIAVPSGPPDNKVFLVAHTKDGVQIYKCTATPNGTTPFSWVFDAPRATLVGDNGQAIGTHFAGPTWQAKDGSKVVAARVDGVTVDNTAIPWLLLKATSTTPGRLGNTTYIQRVKTGGGLAPAAAGCTAETVWSSGSRPGRVTCRIGGQA